MKTSSHISLLSPLKSVRHLECGKDKAPSAKDSLLVIILSLGVALSVSQRPLPQKLAPLMPGHAEARKVELHHSCKY
jgi:hypothetical protein